MKQSIKILLSVAMLFVVSSAEADSAYHKLHNAVIENGDYAEASRLLKSGIDVSVTDSSDRTLMFWAASGYDDDAVKFLIAYGADVNQIVDGNTPLEIAEYVVGYVPPNNIVAILKSAIANPEAYAATLRAELEIEIEQSQSVKKTKTDPLGLGQAALDDMIGKKIPYAKWNKWGSMETLEGTTSSDRWVGYIKKANISVITNKQTDIVRFVTFGKGAIEQAAKEDRWITKQFSEWDGSHYNLTKYIKQQMNAPDSYKHVETFYAKASNGLTVTTTFRGKNAFNATITNRVNAEVDRNGNVVSASFE